MAPQHDTVRNKLDAIEAEMKRLGVWQEQPLAEEQYAFSEAFAMDTMAFSQWLQFIFIPRVRTIVAERGQFPGSSSVAAQAVREFDGYAQAGPLVTLLNEFDELFNRA